MAGYYDLPRELQTTVRIHTAKAHRWTDDVNNPIPATAIICPQTVGSIGIYINGYLSDSELDNVITVLSYYRQSKQDLGTWEGPE